MVGDYMGKNKSTKSKKTDLRREHQKINTSYNNSLSVKSILVVITVIIVVLALFYLLTIGILNKKSKTNVLNNASIQYREILAGEVFDQSDKEYLVLFYDSKADDASDTYSLVTNYNEKKPKIFMYIVDLAEGLNRNCRSDRDNDQAQNVDELKISKTTLIRFKNGKITDYITDNIKDYLDK